MISSAGTADSRRVLITGGLGYVGGRIALHLAQSGYTVRLATRQANATAPAWLPTAEVAFYDATDASTLAAACAGCAAVVHLAALNEIDSGAYPLLASDINNTATLRLLLSAKQSGVERFLYFSTAHIYGAPLVGAIDETKVPRPVHPYAITHRGAEDWVSAAHDKKELCGLIVRLSNSFGAPAHPDVNRWTLLANDLCKQAVTKRTLTLLSSGLQRRDFITLQDVGRATQHLLELPTDACGDGIFNLGGENPARIIDIAELVQARCQEVLGFLPELIRPEPRPGEVSPDLDYSIAKLKSTGFMLEGSVATEIDKTLILCRDAFAV